MTSEANLEKLPKEELAVKLRRALGAIKKFKTEGEGILKMTMQSAAVVGGGVAAGILQVKMPHIPGTQIESELAVGLALTGMALIDTKAEWAQVANNAGSGMLACVAKDQVVKLLSKPAAATS